MSTEMCKNRGNNKNLIRIFSVRCTMPRPLSPFNSPIWLWQRICQKIYDHTKWQAPLAAPHSLSLSCCSPSSHVPRCGPKWVMNYAMKFVSFFQLSHTHKHTHTDRHIHRHILTHMKRALGWAIEILKDCAIHRGAFILLKFKKNDCLIYYNLFMESIC